MKRIQIKKKSHTIVALLNYYKNKKEYRLWLYNDYDKLSIFDNTTDNATHIDITCVIDQYGKLVYWDDNNVKHLTYKRFLKIIKSCVINAQIDIIKRYEKTIKDFYEALTKYALQVEVQYNNEDYRVLSALFD